MDDKKVKVVLNKSTKIDKKLTMPGVEIEVTPEQKKALKEGGFLGDISKSTSVLTDMEVQKLVKRNEELEKQLASGDNKELHEEIKTLKAENDDLKKEIKNLAGDKKENEGILAKFGIK